MTLRELHELLAATAPAHWHVLIPDPVPPAHRAPATVDRADGGAVVDVATGHTHHAVLRADLDIALAWGLREADSDYFEPWLGNLGRMSEVRADRILLDVRRRGTLVDRRRGLAFDGWVLPFPRSRSPRVKGLPDRYFARDDAPLWRLVHGLTFPDGVAFDRVVHRSGLRVE